MSDPKMHRPDIPGIESRGVWLYFVFMALICHRHFTAVCGACKRPVPFVRKIPACVGNYVIVGCDDGVHDSCLLLTAVMHLLSVAVILVHAFSHHPDA